MSDEYGSDSDGVVKEGDVEGRLSEAFTEGLAEGYAEGVEDAKSAVVTVLRRVLASVVAAGSMAKSAEDVRVAEAEAALVESLIEAIEHDDAVETALADDDGYGPN